MVDNNTPLAQCLAYTIIQNYWDWLGTPSTHGLEAFLAGAEVRAGFTNTSLPEWRISGPLNDQNFYAPIVASTGHPKLTIRWATALELIHFSMHEAMQNLQTRIELWGRDFNFDASLSINYPRPAASFHEHLCKLAKRPGMYLGHNSGWLLGCYLSGFDRGGDWLGFPQLPGAKDIIDGIETRSLRSYGSRFAAYRVYDEMPAELLAWVGVKP